MSTFLPAKKPKFKEKMPNYNNDDLLFNEE